MSLFFFFFLFVVFFFQEEDGIRDLVRSRGLGDVYKRQRLHSAGDRRRTDRHHRQQQGGRPEPGLLARRPLHRVRLAGCLLYTSDAADERSSVDLGGRRIIKKKKNVANDRWIASVRMNEMNK